MCDQNKTLEGINQKIDAGEVKVLTAGELLEGAGQGARLSAGDLDLVTLAFSSSLEGCAVMLVVPVAGRGEFTRAKRMWLNGVEGFPGPAPNERMGIVDTLILAEKGSLEDTVDYHGADLIFDLLRGNRIEAQCLTEEGGFYTNCFTLEDLKFARMYTYNSRIPTPTAGRSAVNNAMVTPLDVLCAGDKVLLNQAEGVVIGSGTRSTPEARSLSLAADLFTMDVDMMSPPRNGGRGLGENTVAIPIPILNEQTLEAVTQYLSSQPDEPEDPKQIDREKNLGKFLKQEILAKRFKLNDPATTMGQGNAG